MIHKVLLAGDLGPRESTEPIAGEDVPPRGLAVSLDSSLDFQSILIHQNLRHL